MHNEEAGAPCPHEVLLDQYAPLVLRIIWQVVGSGEKTEELARKVFVKAIQTGQAHKEPEELRRWLAREAIHRATTRRAPAWQWRKSEDADWEQEEQLEHPALVCSAVGMLPPEFCYAIYFHIFEGYETAETSKLLGCSATVVEKNLEKAYTMLQKFLHEPFDGGNVEEYRYAMTAAPVPSYAWRLQTLEAMEKARLHPYFGVFHSRVSAWSAVAGAVVLIALAGVVGIHWWQGQSAYEPLVFPGGTLSQDPGYASQGDRPKLPRPAVADGYVLVKDFDERLSHNPTRDNTDELSELPVYPARIQDEGARQALADQTAAALGESHQSRLAVTGRAVAVELPVPLALPQAAATLDDQAPYFYQQLSPLADWEHAALETVTSYSAEGSPSRVVSWFENNVDQPLVERLLDYTFLRIGDEVWGGRETTRFSIALWPEAAGVLYPIRTAAEAEEMVQADTILHTELVYPDESGAAWIQPMYRFTVIDGDWDLSSYQDEDGKLLDPSLMAVGYEYVPAVSEAYLEG